MASELSEVHAAWRRLEAWLASHAPDAILHPGASADDLRRLESVLGTSLPPQLRASLERHDGEPYDERVAIAAGWPLLSCDGITSEWQLWTGMQAGGDFADFATDIEPSEVIRVDEWFRRGWIPFAGSDGFDLCVDMDPGPAGEPGQVIYMDHETGPAPTGSRSLGAWLGLLADEIDAGILRLDDGWLDFREGAPTRLLG